MKPILPQRVCPRGLAFAVTAALLCIFSSPVQAGDKSKSMNRAWQGIAAGIDDLLISNPSNVVANAAQSASTSADSASFVSAGAESKSTPLASEPILPPPTFYLDFEWRRIQDLTPQGPDGNRYGPTIGVDWSPAEDWTLGGSFGYAQEYRSTTGVSTRSNDFVFAVYGARSFGDWVHVGVTVVYDYQTRILKSFGLRGDGDNNTIGVSPFVGVSHAWGPLSFSSTAIYIYQYNDLNLESNSPTADLSESFGSQGYLHLNEVTYAFSDKFSASLLANFNVELQQDESTYTERLDAETGFWMTWGARMEYQVSDRLGTNIQFQADTFNKNFENYTTTVGLTYQF